MKKKDILKGFLLLIFSVICSYSIFVILFYLKTHCDNKTNIDISYMLNMYKSPSYYCDLVNKSVLEQNEEAIREFSLLKFSDGSTYVHGSILIQIVQEIGEENYLKAIESLPLAKKYSTKRYFRAGKDEGAGDWEKLFPKIYKELDGDVYPTGGFTRPKGPCDNKTNISISYMLEYMLQTDKTPDYYCDLVNKSVLEQDEKAIREFSLLSFSGGPSHVHGDILIQIVQEIGEEKYLKAIKNLPLAKKRGIGGYFEVGKNEGTGDWEKLYPKIYKELKGGVPSINGGFTLDTW